MVIAILDCGSFLQEFSYFDYNIWVLLLLIQSAITTKLLVLAGNKSIEFMAALCIWILRMEKFGFSGMRPILILPKSWSI